MCLCVCVCVCVLVCVYLEYVNKTNKHTTNTLRKSERVSERERVCVRERESERWSYISSTELVLS